MRLLGLAAPLVVAAALAGCGGSSSPSSSAGAGAGFATPGSSHTAATNTVQAVAYVSGAPISKSSYQHWLAVERALGAGGNASHRALAFLITSSWVLGEASARHISVSEAQARKALQSIEHRSFPKAGQLQRFLSTSHETGADLLARERVEMLEHQIAAQISAGKTGAKATAALTSFERGFRAHWKPLTSCDPGYVMEDCKQYRGAPENLSASSAKTTSGGARGGAGKGSSASSSGASSSGEVYSQPGSFSIESEAFERNGAIPATYTCDGKGISPPLSWSHVPAHAAELVLFVIDMSSSTKEGGIRWIVGGIDPSSHGVAAGKVPAGGIVGANTAGKAAYSPICPVHGHTDTVEFVMYALKKPISLSPGFQPAVAEHDYGSSKDILGQAAVNYAVYHRG